MPFSLYHRNFYKPSLGYNLDIGQDCVGRKRPGPEEGAKGTRLVTLNFLLKSSRLFFNTNPVSLPLCLLHPSVPFCVPSMLSVSPHGLCIYSRPRVLSRPPCSLCLFYTLRIFVLAAPDVVKYLFVSMEPSITYSLFWPFSRFHIHLASSDLPACEYWYRAGVFASQTTFHFLLITTVGTQGLTHELYYQAFATLRP